MENTTTIDFQIKFAATKIIESVMVRNEHMQKEIEEGIKAAVDKFDFKTYVEDLVTREIGEALRSSASWGSIRDLARKKADSIVDDYISRELSNLKDNLDNATVFKNDIKPKQ